MLGRLASCVALALACCGDAGPATLEIVSPDGLQSTRVLARSDVVIVTNAGPITNGKVILRDPATYAPLAEAEGEPVWAGRASWQQTTMRSRGDVSAPLTLRRADGSDELVVAPPDNARWELHYWECGDAACTFTWESSDRRQAVDVVSMADLTKTGSYRREVGALRGDVDPRRTVAYHVDRGLRLVAEDQTSGAILWTSPLDPPSSKVPLALETYDVLVSGDSKHVAVVTGKGDHGTFVAPELALFDTATGARRRVKQDRFGKLTGHTVALATVPGGDGLVVATLEGLGAGVATIDHPREKRITSIVVVTLPELRIKARASANQIPREASASPQVTSLGAQRVLLSSFR